MPMAGEQRDLPGVSESDPATLAADFRQALRGVAATVHLITLMDHGAPKGMAATAVASISLEPPSLLVCMNESVSMHGAMAASDWFCVNVLTTGHQDVARAFSDSRLRDIRFETGHWDLDTERAPYLVDAQAALFCRHAYRHSFGTHSIFLAQVHHVRLCGAPDPLIYLEGRYNQPADPGAG
jgi:flavin reductase